MHRTCDGIAATSRGAYGAHRRPADWVTVSAPLPRRLRPLIAPPPPTPGGSVRVGRVADAEVIRATLVVRRAPRKGEPSGARTAIARGATPGPSTVFSQSDVDLRHRGDERDMGRVAEAMRAAGLRVVSVDPAWRFVVVEGRAAQMAAVFGVRLHRHRHPAGHYRTHDEPVHVPAALHPLVTAVVGLDTVPLLRGALAAPRTRLSLVSAIDIARFYRFPATTGAGQRIGILAFGGGFHEADVRASRRRGTRAKPTIRSISVGGARNRPMDRRLLARIVRALNGGADVTALNDTFGRRTVFASLDTMETTMDVELAAALAPAAAVDVYFAPGTKAGCLHALRRALGSRDRPTVLSVSWGAVEAWWGEDTMRAVDDILARAADLRVTVCCASGDWGAQGSEPEFDTLPDVAKVLFPASSPYALACGGTRLDRRARAIRGETAWRGLSAGVPMATGGGVSGFFARPDYQRSAAVPPLRDADGSSWVSGTRTGRFKGRGVPDVAANAATETGYRVRIAGVETSGDGTSAATPVWSALIARLAEQQGGPIGQPHRWLYAAAEDGLRAVTRGNNGTESSTCPRVFEAGPGWNACCGLGTPRGDRLAASLRNEDGGRRAPAAGGRGRTRV
jgi:kumamolisin